MVDLWMPRRRHRVAAPPVDTCGHSAGASLTPAGLDMPRQHGSSRIHTKEAGRATRSCSRMEYSLTPALQAGASVEVFFGDRVGDSEKKRSCNSGIKDTQGIAPQHHTFLGEVQQSHVITWIFVRIDSRATSSTARKCILKSRKNRNASSKARRGVDGVQPHIFHYTETHLQKPKEQKRIFESQKRRGWSPAPHLPLHANSSSETHLRKPKEQKSIFESRKRQGWSPDPHLPLHGNASSKAERGETHLRKPKANGSFQPHLVHRTETHLRKPKEEYSEVASRLYQAKAVTQEAPVHTTCFSSARQPFGKTSRGPCS
ncbi:uncharacterized protein LOC144155217 isoform X2 [Haemaphysalis longicornis]